MEEVKMKKEIITISVEMNRDPIAKNLFRKTGSGQHKGIKDIPRSRKRVADKKKFREYM